MTEDDRRDEDFASKSAKQKLSDMRGRPFDVDAILAQDRARKEREREAAKEMREKLEREHKEARKRRHDLRVRALESEERALKERQQQFEDERRRDSNAHRRVREKGGGEDESTR